MCLWKVRTSRGTIVIDSVMGESLDLTFSGGTENLPPFAGEGLRANAQKQMGLLQGFMEALARGEIPNHAPDLASLDFIDSEEIENAIISARSRTQRKHGMWAMVDSFWTRELADWIGERSCVEVMAGAGWLAKALCEHGVNLVATDLDVKAKWGTRPAVHPVQPLDALAALARYPETEVLLVSWPPYSVSVIESVAEAWGPDRPIIYIGEELGGCTATENFFTRLCVTKRMNIPCWPGLHDKLMVGYYLAH